MRIRLAFLIGSIATVALAVPLVAGGEESSDDSSNEAARVDHCPSLAEANAHYKETGRDFKPTVPCPDPAALDQPPPPSTASAPPIDAESIAEQARTDKHVIVDEERGEILFIEGDPQRNFGSIEAYEAWKERQIAKGDDARRGKDG